MKKLLPLLLLTLLITACAGSAQGWEGRLTSIPGYSPGNASLLVPEASVGPAALPSPRATIFASPTAPPDALLIPTATPFQPVAHTPTPIWAAAGNLSALRAQFAATRAAVLEAAERRHAPRLSLPDLQTLPPSNLHLVYDGGSGRTYIRFTNSIWNGGSGPLELKGRPASGGESIRVTQHIFLQTGDLFDERPVGEFTFHPFHNHWHLEDFSLYEVWSLNQRGGLKKRVASGGKVSYCVTDTSRGEAPGGLEAIPRKMYYNCLGRLQGLTPGWVDTYEFHLYGQWVEITDLPDGTYALVSTVDPDDLIREGAEGNNTAWIYFELLGKRLRQVSSPGE